MNEPQIASLIKSLEAQSARVNKSFADLSKEKFNWKPTPKKWSIAECLAHLNEANRVYLPAFENVASKKPAAGRGIPGVSLLLGQFLVNSMNPQRNKMKKMPSPPSFQPKQSAYDLELIQAYETINRSLIAQIEQMEGCSPDLRVASPAATFVHFRLGELLKMMVWHGDRHLDQAERVLQHQS